MSTNTCRTCKHWESAAGYCTVAKNVVNDFCGHKARKITDGVPAHLFIDITALVDCDIDASMGIDASMRTGPDFGCVLHKPTRQKKQVKRNNGQNL